MEKTFHSREVQFSTWTETEAVLINRTGVRCKHPCRCVLFRRRRAPLSSAGTWERHGTVRRGESVLCVEGPDGEQDQEERHDGDGSQKRGAKVPRSW